MAQSICINTQSDEDYNSFKSELIKRFQSSKINFLIGSGASSLAIKTEPDIENRVTDLQNEDKEADADKLLKEFEQSIINTHKELRDACIQQNNDNVIWQTVSNYYDLLNLMGRILSENGNNLLPKKINLFTTNYDLFIESTSNDLGQLILNDGFERTPCTLYPPKFSSQEYYRTSQKVSSVYNYSIETPSINLIKLHGSLNWQESGDNIYYNVLGNIDKSKTCIILPQKKKFRETVLGRVYYDLLRLYANELEYEQSLLIVTGFSFEDEHIRDITHKSLKNPTLTVIIFAYEESNVKSYKDKFDGYNNVLIYYLKDEKIDLKRLNSLIKDSLPITYE